MSAAVYRKLQLDLGNEDKLKDNIGRLTNKIDRAVICLKRALHWVTYPTTVAPHIEDALEVLRSNPEDSITQ